MSYRHLYRPLFASYHILKLNPNKNNFLLSSLGTCEPRLNSAINNNTKYYRFYSEKAKIEDVTVDFDHVKQATSKQNILIVDVREPDEVKEHGKIPNSINIPLGNVTPALSTMSDKEFENLYRRPKPDENTEIIFYCMIGKRSGMAQQNAINLGYKNVKNYLGSWTDWANKTQ